MQFTKTKNNKKNNQTINYEVTRCHLGTVSIKDKSRGEFKWVYPCGTSLLPQCYLKIDVTHVNYKPIARQFLTVKTPTETANKIRFIINLFVPNR